MEEELSFIQDVCKENMESALAHLQKELLTIRAGRASTNILDDVKVDYYGTPTLISRVSNINTPDGRTITVQPWEKKMLEPITKAIMNANLGFNPVNNGELIRISVPALTEERRKDLAKQVNQVGESAKVGIRAARKEANESLKKLEKKGLSEDLEKDGEECIQNMTTKFNKMVEEIVAKKNEEIFII